MYYQLSQIDQPTSGAEGGREGGLSKPQHVSRLSAHHIIYQQQSVSENSRSLQRAHQLNVNDQPYINGRFFSTVCALRRCVVKSSAWQHNTAKYRSTETERCGEIQCVSRGVARCGQLSPVQTGPASVPSPHSQRSYRQHSADKTGRGGSTQMASDRLSARPALPSAYAHVPKLRRPPNGALPKCSIAHNFHCSLHGRGLLRLIQQPANSTSYLCLHIPRHLTRLFGFHMFKCFLAGASIDTR